MDIVEGETERFAAAGGSCGNVMTLLAFMGWRAAPLARLGDDKAGAFVVDALDASGVDTRFVTQAKNIQTPMVIQKFVESEDGQRTHRFSLTCPECGAWLPRYRATTLSHADEVIETGEIPKVFYFDRVSPAALKLAAWAREHGALVFFEPSSIGDERSFQKAVDQTHILKYSHERLGHVPDLAKVTTPTVIVETHGEDGLRVRWRGRWSRLTAFEAPRFVDAAGSGDWCSAGIIHSLGIEGAEIFDTLNKAGLDRALRFGQALAAVNCGFEGARGAMMALSLKRLNSILSHLIGGDVVLKESPDAAGSALPRGLCGACPEHAGKTRPKKGKASAA
jgi:fructokinase